MSLSKNEKRFTPMNPIFNTCKCGITEYSFHGQFCMMFCSVAHKLHSWNANIDWEDQTCTEIDQQFRAISEMVSMFKITKTCPCNIQIFLKL